MAEAKSTDQQLTPLGNERFNVPAILGFIDAEARSVYGGSERTQIELVARLVRAQQGEIERLRAAICGYVDARRDGGGSLAAHWWELQEIAKEKSQ